MSENRSMAVMCGLFFQMGLVIRWAAAHNLSLSGQRRQWRGAGRSPVLESTGAAERVALVRLPEGCDPKGFFAGGGGAAECSSSAPALHNGTASAERHRRLTVRPACWEIEFGRSRRLAGDLELHIEHPLRPLPTPLRERADLLGHPDRLSLSQHQILANLNWERKPSKSRLPEG